MSTRRSKRGRSEPEPDPEPESESEEDEEPKQSRAPTESERFELLASNPTEGRSTRRRATMEVSYVESKGSSWADHLDNLLADNTFSIAEIAMHLEHEAARDPVGLTRDALTKGLRSGRYRRILAGHNAYTPQSSSH